MRGVVYTYDITIAAIMIIMVAILVYSNISNSSYSYDLLVLQQIAEDAARVYMIRADCSLLNTVIPNQYSYEVYLNDQRVCSRGKLGDVVVSASIPVAQEITSMITDVPQYYYRTCNNRDRNGREIYRCSVHSSRNLSDVLNNYMNYVNYGYVQVIVSR
ncbi:MAG: hypothetical protein NZ908_00215 [Candidatus Micrarchaeota archaeon]|nr:hypothetical protein [Candidatus Micrarchaeota archaeon]MCX8154210.1 hypothetical protein [Candidatus Micrarchaeota archaeon]